MSELGVSSNLLVLMKKGVERENKTKTRPYYDAVFVRAGAPKSPPQFTVYFKPWTLTAWFTWLSWIAGTAAKGRLEVVDGLLKDLPFSALMKADHSRYKPVIIFGQR